MTASQEKGYLTMLPQENWLFFKHEARLELCYKLTKPQPPCEEMRKDSTLNSSRQLFLALPFICLIMSCIKEPMSERHVFTLIRYKD